MPGQAGHDGIAGRLAEKTATGDVLAGKAARETHFSAQILDALPGNKPLSALRCARRQGLCVSGQREGDLFFLQSGVCVGVFTAVYHRHEFGIISDCVK